MKRSRLSVYATTGVLTIAVVIPMATAFLKDGGHYSATLQREALENRPELRASRRALTRLNSRCGRAGEEQNALCRAYTIVQQECFDRQDQYLQNTGCPAINDMARIYKVQSALEMNQPVPSIEETKASSSSSSGEAISGTTFKDLSASDRNVLRRAVRVQNCSKKLPQAMYQLCLSLVGENQKAAPTGLTNDQQQIRSEQHSSQPSTLKDRIEMTKPVAR
ncbi:MAG: hypothetical protein ABIG34_02865 [Candidatus Peregrinibacteria bacterium]